VGLLGTKSNDKMRVSTKDSPLGEVGTMLVFLNRVMGYGVSPGTQHPPPWCLAT